MCLDLERLRKFNLHDNEEVEVIFEYLQAFCSGCLMQYFGLISRWIFESKPCVKFQNYIEWRTNIKNKMHELKKKNTYQFIVVMITRPCVEFLNTDYSTGCWNSFSENDHCVLSRVVSIGQFQGEFQSWALNCKLLKKTTTNTK